MLVYKLLLTLPLLGSVIAGFFSSFLGLAGVSFLVLMCLGGSVVSAVVVFYICGFIGKSVYFSVVTWFYSDMLVVDWGFRFDQLTSIMLVVVLFVSFLVHIYSLGYLSDDPRLPQFLAYISLFTFFMLILVTSDNFIQLFLGWEGVGLCSFLLIGFWYTRIQALKSALKAFLVNRVGDFGLMLGIMYVYINVQAVDFEVLFSLAPYMLTKQVVFLFVTWDSLNLIGFFFFIGAVGKSAQIGLHSWLPDAMEGPTPVSALIHAATMVTAGVFLLVRCSPVFEYTPTALFGITFIGGVTAFLTAGVGLLQSDVKKIIAFSTCSQLGLMVFVCGLSDYAVGLYHLANHAFFKALLFLTAGNLIHTFFGEQDTRQFGGARNYSSFSYASILIGSFALAGLPSVSGFYSKDIILETALYSFIMHSSFIFWLSVITTLGTIIYSIRLVYFVFFTTTKVNYVRAIFLSEAPVYTIFLALSYLMLGSILSGFMSVELFLGTSSDFLKNSVYTFSLGYTENVSGLSVELVAPFFVQNLTIFFFLIALFVAELTNKYLGCFSWFQYVSFLYSNSYYKIVKSVVDSNWGINIVSVVFISKRLFGFWYEVFFSMVDKGFLEVLLPVSSFNNVYVGSKSLYSKQMGYLSYYIFIFNVSLVLLFFGLNFFVFV